MFKAFTDNISSLIGAGEKPSSESGSTENVGLENETSGSQSPVTAGDQAESGAAAHAAEAGATSADEKRGGKVPPPRPNPPLTPSNSICKQDTLPESNEGEQQSGDHSGKNSGTGSVAGDPVDSEKAESTDSHGEPEKKDKLDEKLDEVAGKAREWGSYLFSMTKSAGASVSAKAKELKKVVAENTIIGDFVKEQDKFVSEKKEKARANEAAVPPWVGYNEEEQMKTQMLSLSNDKRNFLRNPPTGVQFHFDYETCYPVAMATLAEDERLKDMRFKLVPKLVSEHDFWRNYFYRVSLIKQSTQLTSLAKMSSTGSTSSESNVPTEKTGSNTKEESGVLQVKSADEAPQTTTSDINDGANEDPDVVAGTDEFISDAYNLEISDEDLMREMEALRASPGEYDPEWEEELQKQLTDYEVVGESGDIDDAALEKEIMKEMSQTG